uniref:TGF-beta family profile domain-containing protein n=1 Tax=Pseudonaja textilis TaxID=8673 RepID=A0A670ZK83_PSETE
MLGTLLAGPINSLMAHHPPVPSTSRSPPQYMVDLYNTVADADGVTKDPHRLAGNTVRSFLDRSECPWEGGGGSGGGGGGGAFNSLPPPPPLSLQELWGLRPWNIYQVLDKDHPEDPEGKRLLSTRLMALQGFGWEIFPITHAVHEWVAEESRNQGLLVTVQGLGGAPLDPDTVQFASGRDHHPSKKPMLVLFTDDRQREAALPSAFPASRVQQQPKKLIRGPRSAEISLPCQRYPLPVDFDEIGWTGWVISPHGYNAYHCKGACHFPLGQSMRPTNHATVQSIIHALKISPEVHVPCCVPDKLFSINLLYFDDTETVVLKQYNGMVAGSCGCH